MTYLSMSSLHKVHADAIVRLVVDDQLAANWNCATSRFRNLVTQYRVVPSNYPTPTLRSRDLRIRLRELFADDFVYLDGDTIFLRPFGEVVACSPISAVLDCNYRPSLGRPCHDGEITSAIHALGWKVPDTLFNGGVLFLQQCDAAGAFCRRWHMNWRSLIGKSARIDHVADQIAFDVTCEQLPGVVTVASDTYNVMVAASPHLTRKARLLHFFSSDEQIAGTLLKHLLDRLEEVGEYDEKAVDRCVWEGHPWGPNAEAWRFRRSGNYGRALAKKLQSALRWM
jgi:hypothetical protein